MICALAWPFQYCYFANLVTDRIELIGEAMYESDWYGYPREFRRAIIMVIMRSQEPINFVGLDIIFCSLEAFGNVSTNTVDRIYFV